MDIPKTTTKVDQAALPANFNDYFQRYLDFDWQYARDQIRDYADGINMAYEAIERHVEDGYKDQIAFVFLGKKGQRETYSYGQMQEQSDRFANVLSGLGIKKGLVLCSLSDRVPILYTAILGRFKSGG
jgi:acetyl-CoA synthetase